MALFVGRLNPRLHKQDLEGKFEKYGRLTRCDLKPQGYAFVTYEDPRDAEDAMRELQGSEMTGCRINIEWSKESGRCMCRHCHFQLSASIHITGLPMDRSQELLFQRGFTLEIPIPIPIFKELNSLQIEVAFPSSIQITFSSPQIRIEGQITGSVFVSISISLTVPIPVPVAITEWWTSSKAQRAGRFCWREEAGQRPQIEEIGQKELIEIEQEKVEKL